MKIRHFLSTSASLFMIATLVLIPTQPAFGEEIENGGPSEVSNSSATSEDSLESEQPEDQSVQIEDPAGDTSNDTALEDSEEILNTDETMVGEGDTEADSPTSSEEIATSEEGIQATSTESPDIGVVTATDELNSEIESSPVAEFQSTTTDIAATTSVENSSDSPSPTMDGTEAAGTPEIVTGNSIALANILNLVNTNFINSDGVIVFENFFETLFGDFDLREMYSALTDFGCSLIACAQDNVTTNISNDASIRNALIIEALTGGNSIEGGASSTISTGNAYAGLNLINVANTNVIDSNYLLVTMNAFQDVEGDIVFPSLSSFFNSIGGTSPDALSIVNTANVINNVDVSAGSGNNTIEGSDQATIATGNSSASTNVFNQLNTSLSGSQSISILFRVHGNWAGEIFGAPPNLGWMEDGEGGIYLFDTSAGNGMNPDSLTVHATNTASIQNDVQVVALTGENAITGAETALISTGNAYAGANIVNVANATVVGRNWILAVINILGDFTGNISFGRPDLWVGAQVDVPEKIENESLLTYTFTVINNGDAPASNVSLSDDYDERYLTIVNSSVPYDSENGKVLWSLGTLPPGMATEITYTARVKDTSYSTDITNLLSVSERESDNNRTDNADTITVTTAHKPSRNGEGIRISLSQSSGSETKATESVNESVIKINRLTASTTLDAGIHEANQKLIVTNTSKEIIRSVVLRDLLTDPEGVMVKDDVWELGDVLPYEEITIEYSVAFSSSAARGVYTLATVIDGDNLQKQRKEVNGQIFLPEEMLTFLPELTPMFIPTPVVLGVTDTTQEYVEEESQRSILPFVIPTANAATRIDHGLPMTNVPYRYSTYLFLLAIALSNLYYMVRRSRDTAHDE